MDFHSMTRKALQALCKKHNIPANGTNLKMADALSALLNQAHEEIKPRGPSCLKGSGRESAAQVAGEFLVNPKDVIRAPKKVTFLLQEEISDEEVSHGKRNVGTISSKIRPEAEGNGVRTGKNECHGTVEEEQERLIRITRSRARKSLVGDVAQSPIVTTKRSDRETVEEKKSLRRVKTRMEVGESEQPCKADELTDKIATRSTKRKVSKLEASDPIDVVTKKDEIGRIPLTTTVEAEENGVKSKKNGSDETLKEEHGMLARTTRSRAKKSLVGDVTQFPIAQKRNTRRSQTATDEEKNIDSNQEEKRNQSNANANREVGEISCKNSEIKGDGKNSQQPDKAVQLTEIHFRQDKATRQSTCIASKLSVSVPADAGIQKNEVAGVSLKMTAEAEETGTEYRKKEIDETVERTQVLLVRTLRSHARQSLAGDVAQFPIVEKRTTRKGAESETYEENNVNVHGENKKKPSRAKSKRKVGEISNDSETKGHLMESRKENESTERHSQPEKATRRSKCNVPKLAASVQIDVAMQNDEIVRSNGPRKQSKNKILEEVDYAAENATVISKENVADRRARHDSELKVVDELQGQSKRLASSKHEVSAPCNERDGHKKQRRDLVPESGAVERANRSKCPISSDFQSRRITKVAGEQVQENALSACEEAAEISIIEEFVAIGSGNLPTDCTGDGITISVDGIVMADNSLKTAEVVEVSIETTKTPKELDRGGAEVVELKDSTIEVSACKGDKEISEAVNVTVFPQVSSGIVEMAQSQEADLEVASEGTGAISDVNKVDLEVRIAGDSSESYQEKGAEGFAHVRDIGDVLKFDCEETSAEAQMITEAAAVSSASCIHYLSHIHVNDDLVRNVSEMVDEFETSRRLSLGQQIYLEDIGEASSIQISPEKCVIEHHAVFYQKDQPEFTESNDRFVKTVHGARKVISSENGITQGDSEVSDHVCLQEENGSSNGIHESVLEGLKETVMPELGSVGHKIYDTGFRSPENDDPNVGEENGNDATDSTSGENAEEENAFLNEISQTDPEPRVSEGGEKNGDDKCRVFSEDFRENPEMVKEEAVVLGCKTGMEHEDIIKEVQEINVKTMEDNGGDVNETGSAEILDKYSSDERFKNSVASPEISDVVEECETIENLLSGQEIYPGDNGLASCAQSATEDVVERHGAVELVSGDREVVSYANGITQGNIEESDHEVAREENAFLKEISAAEFGSIQTASEQYDILGGEEENGDDAQEICRIVSKEFRDAPEIVTEGCDGGCKTSTDLKDNDEEVEKRNLKTIEDNAGDMDEQENADMKSLASPNLLNMVEEHEAIEKPSSGQKICLGDDALPLFTQITPDGVNKYDILKKEKESSEAHDRFAETVTRNLVNGEFQAAQGNSEESDHKGAEEENGFLNGISRHVLDELGEIATPELTSMKPEESSHECRSTLTVSKCHAMGAEENGDDAKDTQGVVSLEFEHEFYAIFTEVADQDCEVCVELSNHSENVKKINASTVEVNREDMYGKENEEMLMHKFGDDKRSENSFAEGSQRFEVLESEGTAEMVAFGVCALSSVSTPKPQDSLARTEKMSLSKQILSLEKHKHGDDTKIHVGGTAKKHSNKVANILCECDVGDEAIMCVDGDVVTAEEAEDGSSLHCVGAEENCETGQEISGQNKNESSLHEELGEASGATENENEQNAKAVAQSALVKLECKDQEKIVEVKGLREGMSYEEGNTPENIEKEECIVAFTESLKVEAYQHAREDILYTMDQELQNEDNHKESEKRENADHEGENLHRKESEEAICLKHEHLEVQGDKKTTVAMFGSGTTFLTPIIAPDCQGINQEVLVPEKFASEQYLEGSTKSLRGTTIAMKQVEDDSPVKCEGTGMRSKEPHKISGAKETESCWKEYGKASNLEDTLGAGINQEVLVPEKFASEQYLEGSAKSLRGTTIAMKQVEDDSPVKCEGTGMRSKEPHKISGAKETESCWKEYGKASNLEDTLGAGINQEVLLPEKFASEQYLEGSTKSLRKTTIAMKQVEDDFPVKCEGTGMRSKEPHKISGAKETKSCWKEYGKASNLEGTLGELQLTTEILGYFASEKLDCKDHAEIVEKGSEEAVLEKPGCMSFEEVRANEKVLNKNDFFCDCTQVMQENEHVLAMEKELELEVFNLFDKEMAYMIGDELKYDDCKKINERNDAEKEMKNSDCKGSEDAGPVKCEDPLNVQEVEEKNADAGALSTVLVPDDDAEHQVLGNEHGRDLAFVVDAVNIRSPVTDSSNRHRESYLSEKHEHDGQEENGISWRSSSRDVLNKDLTCEGMLNLIGSGSSEARVEEIGSLFGGMWISTVQAEKQTCGITSQTLKSVESLEHWPSSVEMKENTPVVKQGQFSNRSLGKSAMSVHKRRALQDLQIVKEQ